ncbi:hypothetical protein [Acinetobacter variabilis]|uniref:hypothetical protein n=1 Tax=Acinetobacter variabilis TaxID=70346 RepID=UPI0028992D2C|nr:hypothetical protein [Acinetobacter variabilis]
MKNYIEMHARGSGRSTRLLEEALELSASEKVMVICHSESSCREMMRLFQYLAHWKKSPIKYLPTFETPSRKNIDWHKKEVLGFGRVLIDHHVWAVYFGFAIEGFHEYDNQVNINPRSLD